MPVPIVAAAGRAAAGTVGRRRAAQAAAGAVHGSRQGAAGHRVGNITAFFMLGTAFLLDCFQFFLNLLPIPVIGWVLSMFVGMAALCIFAVWFLVLGVGLFGGRKAGVKMASAILAPVIEIIPLVGALPGTTLGVLGIIIASRLEDRERPSA